MNLPRSAPAPALDIEGAYAEHRHFVYNYLRRCGVPPEAAEDLTQSVFATLIQTIGRFDPARGTLRGYLVGIARNQRRNLRRWTRREARRSESGPEARAAGSDVVAIVREAVMSLPDEQREALVLREFHGCSYQEIAAIQDVPVGTIRSRIARAREALVAKLT